MKKNAQALRGNVKIYDQSKSAYAFINRNKIFCFSFLIGLCLSVSLLNICTYLNASILALSIMCFYYIYNTIMCKYALQILGNPENRLLSLMQKVRGVDYFIHILQLKDPNIVDVEKKLEFFYNEKAYLTAKINEVLSSYKYFDIYYTEEDIYDLLIGGLIISEQDDNYYNPFYDKNDDIALTMNARYLAQNFEKGHGQKVSGEFYYNESLLMSTANFEESAIQNGKRIAEVLKFDTLSEKYRDEILAFLANANEDAVKKLELLKCCKFPTNTFLRDIHFESLMECHAANIWMVYENYR